MAKMAAWVGVRVDRITERWDRFAEAVSARWDRSLDRIADPVGSVRRDRIRSLRSCARPDRRPVGSVRRSQGAPHRVPLRRMGPPLQPPSRPKGDRPVGRRATSSSSRRMDRGPRRLPRSSASRLWRPCPPSVALGARGRPRSDLRSRRVIRIRPSIDPAGGGCPGGATSCLRRIQHEARSIPDIPGRTNRIPLLLPEWLGSLGFRGDHPSRRCDGRSCHLVPHRTQRVAPRLLRAARGHPCQPIRAVGSCRA